MGGVSNLPMNNWKAHAMKLFGINFLLLGSKI